MMISTFANKMEGSGKRYTVDGKYLYKSGDHKASFVRSGGKLYATGDNPDYKNTRDPMFEISGSKVRPTSFHPNGYTSAPWYEIAS